MMQIHDIFTDAVRMNYDAFQASYVPSGGPPRLWPSELGGCPRKSIYRVSGTVESNPFDDYVKELILNGLLWEDWIAHNLKRHGYSIQVPASNQYWSGRIDAVKGTEIVEIKDTAEYNFSASGRLPYDHHLLQLLAYQRLWSGSNKCTLYYHGRGKWAQFAVEQTPDGILYNGQVGQLEVQGFSPLHIDEEMGRFETFLVAFRSSERLPDRPYESPFQERFACTKEVKKARRTACVYCNLCWPELPLQDWYNPDAWVGGSYDETAIE